jgi:hypothetical protein
MNTNQHNKPIATVLVIDDDRGRDEVYKKFFGILSNHKDFRYHIKPNIPTTPSAATCALNSREPCLVVLDMMLNEEWGEQVDEIYIAMNRTQCPMGLLSVDFNSISASKSANKVFSKLKAVPKVGLWPYVEAIEKYCKGLTVGQPPKDLGPQISFWNNIFEDAMGHGKHWQPHSPGEVTFLHLTDTHFGNSTPDYLNAVAISNGAKGRNNSDGAAALIADYLLWTGDITNLGLPDEFEKAMVFAKDIVKAELLPKSSPIAIVPGNHDLCWPLSLSSRMAFEDIPNEPEAESAVPAHSTTKKVTHQRWVVKDTLVNPMLWRYGTQPFRDFYADLVGELAPTIEIGFRWHTEWAHLGFAVLELPIEAHVVQSNTSTEKPPPFVSNEEFKAITDSAIESFQELRLKREVCIVVLIQGRAPDQPESGAARWSELIDRIEEGGHATIVFGGHEHAATHITNGRRLTIIGAPHDPKQTIETDSLPGVGFIRLLGLGTSMLKCEVTKVQRGTGDIDPSKWVQLSSKRYEIAAADPHPWSKVTVFSSNPN